jgi:DHA1 family multidrug resistance protein-like MFS transporter
MKTGEVMKEFLWRPFQLMAEPAVFFINLYIGLAYAIFYLWFEAFPLVFNGIYHMSEGVGSLPFIGIIVGAVLSYGVYAVYLYSYLNPKWERQGSLEPEERLGLAVVAGFSIPISLLIFGWTSRASVHWIVPTIGAGLYIPGIFLLFQSGLVYLPLSYQRYAASVLAGNDFFRSTIAAAFPLFGRAFFKSLGMGGGNSLLAGVTLAMIPALYLLMKKGAQLRALSKYATS